MYTLWVMGGGIIEAGILLTKESCSFEADAMAVENHELQRYKVRSVVKLVVLVYGIPIHVQGG